MQEDDKKISGKLEDNIAYLKDKLQLEFNFDIVLRRIEIGGKKAAMLFVDGLTDDMATTFIMQSLFQVKREQIVPNAVKKILQSHLPYIEAETADTINEVLDEVLGGPLALFIDGEKEAVIIDTRTYPARDTEEPDIEKITRGSRDGFIETLVFNVALVRRRIRDPQLRAEIMKVGRRSRTEVVMMYVGDITNPELVADIRGRIEAIDVDALPMAEKTVEEFIRGTYWNPFPEVRYTERPDVAAIHLMEGHVIIMVDTSPSVMIAPTSYFHHLQHAEEYRHDPAIGIYIRWVRMLGIFASFLMVPLWLLVVLSPELLPPALDFIGPEEEYSIPLALQFVFAHFGVDLIRLASIHTPSALATALGLVGALLIGQIAVDVGFFVPEVLLYMGLVAIGVFSTPSWELSMANRLVLLLMIILTGLFKIYGFIAGLLIILVILSRTKSFGYSYLWPLWPFDARGLYNVLFRRPIPVQEYRPGFLRTRDKDRLS